VAREEVFADSEVLLRGAGFDGRLRFAISVPRNARFFGLLGFGGGRHILTFLGRR
jgi:hypothetical protein